MRTIERVMQVMTHVNIGATLGMLAWILWSGQQAASGDREVARPVTHWPAQERTEEARPERLPCCFVPAEESDVGPRRPDAHDAVEQRIAVDTAGDFR